MPNGPEPSLQYVDYCNPRDITRFIKFGSIGLVVTPVYFFFNLYNLSLLTETKMHSQLLLYQSLTSKVKKFQEFSKQCVIIFFF